MNKTNNTRGSHLINGQKDVYDAAFFENQVGGSVRSARTLVPYILSLHPTSASVADVGCGTGSWLRQYVEEGLTDVLGVDGFLPEEALSLIPANTTLLFDLSKPLDLGRRFDIAQSLEVAEHLPSKSAPVLVQSLVDLSDFVVFGAAVPGQGGTSHINEQWQSYWISLFEARGYAAFDVIRPAFWYSREVEWWYLQNTFVFVNRARTDLINHLSAVAGEQTLPFDIVHPMSFADKCKKTPSIENLWDAVPQRFRNADHLRKLHAERRSWDKYAIRYPWRIQYWMDLYRIQRRRKRENRQTNTKK